jgi:hypothetical protein
VSDVHIADTGLFVAMGAPSNDRYRAVRRFARRNDVTLLVPQRVYDELSTEATGGQRPPVEDALDDGWVAVADSLDFTRSVVSRTMDGVQQYIANADDRPADEVERADAALAALAAQRLEGGTATEAYLYMTDIAAGEAAETVLGTEGFGDSVTFVNAFRLLDDLADGGN